jgi:hypothetical protein
MILDENKYSELFLKKFKANENQFKGEFNRIISEHGYSEEIKLKFYQALFRNLIDQFKRDLKKDEHFEFIITSLYNYFIRALKEDNIDTSDYENELQKFKEYELPKIIIDNNIQVEQLPDNKSYNLNTKYGRRKAREQAIRNYNNGTPEYRNEIDKIRSVFWIVIILIVVVVFVIKLLLT